MRIKSHRIVWLPASLLALSAGLIINGCEDPSEVSEEELEVETIDEDGQNAEPAEGDAKEIGAPREEQQGKGWHGGWKDHDDDDGHGKGWHGGWKDHDDDDGHGKGWHGGWKDDDDGHGKGWHGGWKDHDDDDGHGHGGWHGGWK